MMIERKQSEDTAPCIIVLCLEKAWGKIGTVWKQTAATDLGDDREQAV